MDETAGKTLRSSLDVVQHLAQRQLQRLQGIRAVGRDASARVFWQGHGIRSGCCCRNPGRLQCTAGVGYVVDDPGCVPGRRVEHHAHGGFARLRGRGFGSPVALGDPYFMNRLGTAVAFPRRGAGLATSDPAPNAPDLLDIVDTIRFLLEEELIEMAAQRGRSKRLVTVLTFPILGELVVQFRARLGVFVGARIFGGVPGGFLLHVIVHSGGRRRGE